MIVLPSIGNGPGLYLQLNDLQTVGLFNLRLNRIFMDEWVEHSRKNV